MQRTKVRLLVCTLLYCFSVEVADQTSAHATEPLPNREVLIQQCIVELRHEMFDSVLANSATLCKHYPKDPIGYFIAADVYQTMMRNYRVRTFEAQFDSLIDLTVGVARSALKSSPTAENYFILGAAEGYRCLHQFRRGECLKATNGAMTSVKILRLATEVQPEYADPLFGLALYEYGKGKVLGLGLGLSANTRKDVVRNLERVRQEGRYMSINATYALQTVYLEAGDLAKAMEINNQLYQQFPQNSGCLYNRALLLEKLHCSPEAIPVWKALITRIEAFSQPSNGYLAECHYHLAEIYRCLGESEKAWDELDMAAMYVSRYQPKQEMNGPYTTFKEIRKAIEQATDQPSEQRRISSIANIR